MRPPISVAILNYRRQENVIVIIDTLRRQTVPVKILVWDNSGSNRPIPGADLVVTSSANMFCWPRWLLLSQSTTNFCMTLDDDLNLATPGAIEVIVTELERLEHPFQILGPEGVVLASGQPYFPKGRTKVASDHSNDTVPGSKHIVRPKEDVHVDVVKGRCMAMRRDALRRLPLLPDCADMCDDIAVSAALADGRSQAHRVLAAFCPLFTDLPGKNDVMALSSRSDWVSIREAARRTHYPQR